MALRNQITTLTVVCAMLLATPHTHAASTPPAEKTQPEPGQKQIEYSAAKLTNVRRAQALKAAADYNFTQNNLDLAANFYLRALALAPEIFSVGDKKLIANRLVAAHRQREAIEVLRQLALDHGSDVEISVSLAKLLSATQDYSAAIAEVDKVLNQDQGNKYALLLKANSLRSQQKFGQSVALYRSILKKGEDFDARLGLTYSLLAIGEKTKARDSFGKFKTDDEDQLQQVDELSYYLLSATRPTVDLYEGTFVDSEHNHTTEQRVTLRGTSTDWDLVASYGRKSARSEVETDTEPYTKTKTYTADYVTGSASTNFSEVVRLRMTLGQTKLGADTRRSFTTRDVTVDLKTGLQPMSTLSVALSHDVITTTGSQIAKMIEVDQSGIKYTRALNTDTTLYLNYHYKEYSDLRIPKGDGNNPGNNAANDIQGITQYTLYRGASVINIGYSYRRMNYHGPGTGGYFAPQNYAAHQGFVTLYYEYAPFFFDIETDYGQQQYDLRLAANKDKFKYLSATLGTAASSKLHLEIHGEFNRSESVKTGYKYHDQLLNAQVSYMF